ncbi:hypothetical protein Lepto7375DRAFT_1181 [Leptolyngbya sp. PCC 7375]|nr:hypothetical protein Lepto7375DRAFT_1181 [Leptolyngbya sp. PCC 7375]
MSPPKSYHVVYSYTDPSERRITIWRDITMTTAAIKAKGESDFIDGIKEIVMEHSLRPRPNNKCNIVVHSFSELPW